MEEVKRELVRASNPDYIQQSMWPLIVELADILNDPNISAHSLMAYFLYGEGLEIWAALKNSQLIGFVCFQIAGPPYYSTGVRNFIYMKEKDEELSQQLSDKFEDFLKRHRFKYFMYHSQDKKVGDHFATKLGKIGLERLKSEYIHTGKRKIGG